MNKTFKIIKILSIFLLVILVVAAGVLGITITLSELEALDGRIPTTCEYSDYVIVDRNLICTDTGEILGQYKQGLNHFTYQEIKGIDKEKHIVALMSTKDPIALFTSTSAHVVLTSPDLELNIWEDWTIDKIEFVCDTLSESEDQDLFDNGVTTVFTSSDREVLNNFEDIIKYSPKIPVLPMDIYFEHPRLDGQDAEDFEYGIRVSFKKINGIIWKSKIYIASHAEYIDSVLEYGESKKFFIEILNPDQGQSLLEIPEDTALYKLIREALYNQ